MDADRFWQLIEESRRTAGDCEEQAGKLADRLAPLPPEEIVSFQNHLDERMRECYRWDLWAVGYIVNGGCSDDGFDYFRGWLIAQGREFFEMVMRTPERVGEGVVPGAERDYDHECESILYVAHEAYEFADTPTQPWMRALAFWGMGTLAICGALLALALVQPRGRLLPRRLLLVPAWVASVGLVLWGLGYFYLPYFLAVGRVVSAPEFAAQDAHPAAGWGFYWYAVFLAWGIALGAAAWWSRRTRPGTPRGTRDG